MSDGGTEATCSCEVFAASEQAGGGAGGHCHHTVFTLRNLEALLRLPGHEPGEVVPIGSAIQLRVRRGGADCVSWAGRSMQS